jgi:uncharacterized membrane protein YheB (UPF0754 family)
MTADDMDSVAESAQRDKQVQRHRQAMLRKYFESQQKRQQLHDDGDADDDVVEDDQSTPQAK